VAIGFSSTVPWNNIWKPIIILMYLKSMEKYNYQYVLWHSFKKFSTVAAAGTEPISMSPLPQFAYLQYSSTVHRMWRGTVNQNTECSIVVSRTRGPRF
jgi:hypothetical protein